MKEIPKPAEPRVGSPILRRLLLPASVAPVLALLIAGPYLGAGVDLYHLDIFPHLFVVQESAGAFLMLGILALAALAAPRLPAAPIVAAVRRIGRRPEPLLLAVLLALALSTRVVYHGHPLALDEFAPHFQAQAFAAGEIGGRFPPPLVERLIPPFFIDNFWTVDRASGRVVSNYWPGYALLLTPFARLGVPWLLNPLLATAALWLLGRLARRLTGDDDAAGWATVLAIASPGFLANAISHYSMTAHLLMNLLFATLLVKPTRLRALAAGGVGSLALVLHHPIPHALFALPWLLWLAWRRARLDKLALLLLGYLPLSLLIGVGWFNYRMGLQAAGEVAELGSQAAASGGGAGIAGIAGLVATVVEILSGVLFLPTAETLATRLMGYVKLFLWAVPGLPILAWWGWRQERGRRWARLVAGSVACTVGAYFLIRHSQGHGWGFRYVHQLWWVLPLLAAAFLAGRADDRQPWVRAAALAAVLSLALAVPLRFAQIHGFIGRHLDQLPPRQPGAAQVCFVSMRKGYYTQDLVQNDPFLRAPVLYMVSYGRELDERLVQQLFPGSELTFDDGEQTVWKVTR